VTHGGVRVGEAGKRLYAANCMVCHGANMKGGGNFPSLVGVSRRYNEDQFLGLISGGRRMMPAFKQLSDAEKGALAAFVLGDAKKGAAVFVDKGKEPEDPYFKMPFHATGYNKFLTKEGYPAVAPPWGTLTAVDLNRGVIVWRDTLGDYPEFKAKGIHTGTENYGGPVVTAGGLVFIAATNFDRKFRAFDKSTGALLWETTLPFSGNATPATYDVNGRQFVVIGAGGGKDPKSKSGGVYVAFALEK
jgi:quinoprotein glucose dehydrogenase